MKHHFNNQTQNSINWKWTIIWVLIHFISLCLISLVLNELNINNNLAIVLLYGFGITIISRIIKTFTLRKRFVIDKWFFFWSLINTSVVWIILLLMNLLQIINPILILFIIGITLETVSHLVKRMYISNTAMMVISIILISLLLIIEMGVININTSYAPINLKSMISKLFSSISFNYCPQLDYLSKINQLNGQPKVSVIPSETAKLYYLKYEESFLGLSWGINSYELKEINCRKGSKENENRNNFYCGNLELPATYMVFYDLDENSNIRKIIERSFINEYDANGKFLKTICGRTPNAMIKEVESKKQVEEEQLEREFKEFINIFR